MTARFARPQVLLPKIEAGRFSLKSKATETIEGGAAYWNPGCEDMFGLSIEFKAPEAVLYLHQAVTGTDLLA